MPLSELTPVPWFTRDSYTQPLPREGNRNSEKVRELPKELMLQAYCVLGSQFTRLRVFL